MGVDCIIFSHAFFGILINLFTLFNTLTGNIIIKFNLSFDQIITFFIHNVVLQTILVLVSHKFCFHTSGTSVCWMNWCFGRRVFEPLAQTRYKPLRETQRSPDIFIPRLLYLFIKYFIRSLRLSSTIPYLSSVYRCSRLCQHIKCTKLCISLNNAKIK